jgi:protein-L-isoaspartate(D-aspartate) O-methyltransferase
VVARMLEILALRPTDRVLDVGTGSGYHAALLSLLADHVFTVERHPGLTEQARATLADLGIDNVTFRVGDGWEGWPDYAPFDAINVAAATGHDVPETLEDQLIEGGRMVAPVGARQQHLILTERRGGRISRRQLEAVQFVPLVHGEERE